MGCETVRDLLPGYSRGRLTPAEDAAVRDHLLACPACAKENDAVGRTLALVSQIRLDPVPLPDDLFDRIPLDPARPLLRVNRKALAAAALLLACFTGLALLVTPGQRRTVGLDLPVWTQGQVWSVTSDEGAQELHAGTLLPPGAGVRTGPDGLCRLRLGDRAEAALLSKSELALGPDGPTLVQGKAFFRVSPSTESFSVRAGSAIVRVHGTAFFVTVGPHGTHVEVLLGTVTLSSNGKDLLVQGPGAGQAGPGAPPLPKPAAPDVSPPLCMSGPLLLTVTPPRGSEDTLSVLLSNVSGRTLTVPAFHPDYPRFVLQILDPDNTFTVNLSPFHMAQKPDSPLGTLRLEPGASCRITFTTNWLWEGDLLRGRQTARVRVIYQAPLRRGGLWSGRVLSPTTELLHPADPRNR
jgi:ferric-dicitrate binding protein FerR (iron transport regulator)